MPIERSGRPSRSASARTVRNARAHLVVGALRADRHQARARRGRGRGSPRPPRRPAPARSRPAARARSRSPARAPTRPGAWRAISAASDSRSTDCHRCTNPATWRTLLRWSRPTKCQRTLGVHPLGLGDQLLGVALADVDEPGGHRLLHPLGRVALGDGHDRAPGRGRRRRRRCARGRAARRLGDAHAASSQAVVAKRSASPRARWLYQRRSQAVQPDGVVRPPSTPASRERRARTPAARSSGGRAPGGGGRARRRRTGRRASSRSGPSNS